VGAGELAWGDRAALGVALEIAGEPAPLERKAQAQQRRGDPCEPSKLERGVEAEAAAGESGVTCQRLRAAATNRGRPDPS
jgi:hypothetical protein